MEDDSWENWLSHFDLGVNDNLWYEEKGCYNSQEVMEELGSWCGWRSERERTDELEKNGGTKKGRTSSDQATHHIMSERKRRREISEKFIALSATIPDLKKIDKSSILQEAINYVRQLQERIAVLEKETNNESFTPKSLIIPKSSLLCSATSSHEALREVVARSLEKEVFIRIHCEKRKGIMINLLPLLRDIHLSITSFSILPFGDSFLHIIIIAQMSEEYTLTVNDLVKTLKHDLLKLHV